MSLPSTSSIDSPSLGSTYSIIRIPTIIKTSPITESQDGTVDRPKRTNETGNDRDAVLSLDKNTAMAPSRVDRGYSAPNRFASAPAGSLPTLNGAPGARGASAREVRYLWNTVLRGSIMALFGVVFSASVGSTVIHPSKLC
jgi:hypothetical protein